MMGSEEALKVSLRKCLLFEEGHYKATLELQCQNEEKLKYECLGENVRDLENGKVLVEEWKQTGGKENPVVMEQRQISVQLSNKSTEYPIYLYATLFKSNTDREISMETEDYDVIAHGRILLYPKKRLFKQNKTTQAMYTCKMKLASLLQNEMVQSVCGWFDLKVKFNISRPSTGQSESVVSRFQKSKPALDLHQTLHDVNGNLVFNNTTEEESKHKLATYSSTENLFSVADAKDRELNRTPSIYHLDSEKKIFAKSLKTKYSNVDYFSTRWSASIDSLSNRPGQLELVQARESPSVGTFQKSRRFLSREFDKNAQTNFEGISKVTSPIIHVTNHWREESRPLLNFSLPDLHAVRSLLPQYYSLAEQPPRSYRTSVVSHVPIQEPQTFATLTSRTEYEPADGKKLSKSSYEDGLTTILHHHKQQLDQHKLTIQRMAKHINMLNREVEKLQHDKSQLLDKLYYAGDDIDFGNEGKTEEHTKLVIMRRRLAAENVEKKELLERVHILQNEMIQKNEAELTYLQLQKAHEQQQATLQDAQAKIAKSKLLEKTCLDQEKVIEKLEKEIRLQRQTTNNNDNKCQDIGLQHETTNRNDNKVQDKMDIKENDVVTVTRNLRNIDEQLTLMADLEHAHNTIEALQQQMERNAKTWIQEKMFLEGRTSTNHRAINNRPPLRPMKTCSFDDPMVGGGVGENKGRDFPRYSYHLAGRGGGMHRRQHSYPYQ